MGHSHVACTVLADRVVAHLCRGTADTDGSVHGATNHVPIAGGTTDDYPGGATAYVDPRAFEIPSGAVGENTDEILRDHDVVSGDSDGVECEADDREPSELRTCCPSVDQKAECPICGDAVQDNNRLTGPACLGSGIDGDRGRERREFAGHGNRPNSSDVIAICRRYSEGNRGRCRVEVRLLDSRAERALGLSRDCTGVAHTVADIGVRQIAGRVHTYR